MDICEICCDGNIFNEQDLREKAYEWTSFVKSDNLMIKTIAVECAMIGYKKAKEGE